MGWYIKELEVRQYVKDVKLVIIDEVHMIGQDRGPIIEVIVARIHSMNSVNEREQEKIRIVALSTSLSNARQLALWLGCCERAIFNVSGAYRPVPVRLHIEGFSNPLYCPRMNE